MGQSGWDSGRGAFSTRRADSELRKTDLTLARFSRRPRTGMALPLVALGLVFMISGFGTVGQAAVAGAIFVAIGIAITVVGLRLYAKRI
jgi:hypothetical protein